jgi:hypothetical protein
MKQKITKKELIEELRAERARLEALLGDLTNEQMEIPGVQGEWSVKDIIAHITVWEHRGIDWLRAVANGKEPQVPEPGYTQRDQKALNLQTYQENRERPLQEILNEFKRSFPILMKEVEDIAEEQLDRTFQGEWTRDQLITGWHIAAWRFWHYRSHREHVEQWMAKNQS